MLAKGVDTGALQRLLAGRYLTTSKEGDAQFYPMVVNSAATFKIMANPARGANEGAIPVQSVAVSPDGTRIASGSNDDKARVWDADTNFAPREFNVGGKGPAWSVAFSPDGNRIAAGDEGGALRVWDVRSGASVADPMRRAAGVNSLAFGRDGKRIATGTGDGAVHVWEVATGTRVATIPARGENGLVRSLAFNPAEDAQDLVASGGNDYTVTLWDTKNGRPVAERSGRTPVKTVAFSPTGDRVVAGRLDGTIEILNGRTLAPLGQQFVAHPNLVYGAAFSPDGSRIVSGGDDNTVKVWDAFSHVQIGNPLRGHHGAVSAVAFNNTGTRIVSGGLDGSVYEWDAVFGLSIPAGQGEAIRAVAFSNSDGHLMASGGTDGTVKLWDTKTAKLIGTLGQPSPDGERAMNSLAFNHDGSRIVTAGKDGRVILWDVATSRPVVELSKADPLGGVPLADPRMQSVAFSKDGKKIVAGGMDGVVRLWGAVPPYSSTAVTAHRVDGLTYQVWSVAFSPDGRKVVSGSGFDRAGNPNNLIQMWNADTLTADGDPIEGEPGFAVYSVGFDHTGDLVFSGSFDGTARVWDVATHKEAAKPLSGDQNPVLSVGIAHSHQWIATGGGSGTVRL